MCSWTIQAMVPVLQNLRRLSSAWDGKRGLPRSCTLLKQKGEWEQQKIIRRWNNEGSKWKEIQFGRWKTYEGNFVASRGLAFNFPNSIPNGGMINFCLATIYAKILLLSHAQKNDSRFFQCRKHLIESKVKLAEASATWEHCKKFTSAIWALSNKEIFHKI